MYHPILMEERASSALQPLSSVLMQGERNGKRGEGGQGLLKPYLIVQPGNKCFIGAHLAGPQNT